MSQTDKVPVVPRPAATILVIRDDPFEVLMVRRHSEAYFSSALVFPGGLVDPGDRDPAWLELIEGADAFDEGERALRIAAYRETYEEAAILAARGATGTCPAPADAAGVPFHDIVRATGGKLDLAGLERFGHWVTPATAPKRFDTHFFLCAAPSGQEAVCDGGETVALEWIAPRDAIARAEAGERSILFPTLSNLRRLVESETVAEAMAAARRRPPFTVHPRAEKREGGMAVVIPAEAGYPVTEHFHPREERA